MVRTLTAKEDAVVEEWVMRRECQKNPSAATLGLPYKWESDFFHRRDAEFAENVFFSQSVS